MIEFSLFLKIFSITSRIFLFANFIESTYFSSSTKLPSSVWTLPPNTYSPFGPNTYGGWGYC